jgi:uncharacterized radical SAM superfamily Fe-S cluster-containing enzyme
MKVLDRTVGLCSSCLGTTPAMITEDGGRVYLEKNCCKPEKVLLENDPEFYRHFLMPFKIREIEGRRTFWEINDEDSKVRADTQLYVTSKCNLRCPICYQKMTIPQHDLTLEEINFILKRNRSKNILLTGGEPTVRKDLPELIKFISEKKKNVFIVTNGLKLTDRLYLRRLKKAGLKGVAFSFDGFKEEVYEIFRGKKLLKKKLKALENLKKEKIPIYLTCVIEKSINLDQISPVISYACKNEFVYMVRFGWLYKNPQTTTRSDIFKELARSLDLSLEYFYELKKFYLNIYKLIGKTMGKKIQKNFYDLNRNAFFFRVKNRKCKPIFNYSELKHFNKMFEEGILNSTLIRTIYKTAKIGGLYFLHKINPSLEHLFFRNGRILKICVGGVSFPSNLDLCRQRIHGDGILNIAYDGGKFKPLPWFPANITIV